MIRKLFFLLVVLGFFGGLGYWFFLGRQIDSPVSNTLSAIPTNAGLIIETNQFKGTWEHLHQTSIIWEELCNTPTFANIDSGFYWLDSLLGKDDYLQPLLDDHSLFLSAHRSNANSYNFLYSFSLPPTIKEHHIANFIESSTTATTNSKEYDQAVIHSISPTGKDFTFCYALYKGIFVGSFSMLLVEDAIRQINAPTSLLDEAGFIAALSTSKGSQKTANIYIKHSAFPTVAGTYLNQSSRDAITFLSDYADWTELDLQLKPNTAMMVGFTVAPDSVKSFLNVFARQKPQSADMVRVIPYNTATLVHFGFSDFKSYLLSFRSWLKKKNKLFGFEKRLKKLNDEYGVNVGISMLSWVENEMALLTIEAPTTDLEQHTFAVLKTNDSDFAESSLKELMDAIAAKNGKAADSTNIKGYPIRHIDIPGLFPALLGGIFSGLKDNYFAQIGDYYVFGNSPAALKHIIHTYEADKTLYRDLNYQKFADNLSNRSNLFVYSSVPRSVSLYKSLLNKEWKKSVNDNEEMYQQFEAVAWQVARDRKDLYFNNVFLKHNPVYKQETTSLWEAALDTAVANRPWLMTNHYTKGKEVFVQDVSNTIYLIGSTGKLEWKRTIDQPIVGEAQQIDILANGKLQMIFSTRDKIYVLDRKGRDVAGFPIRLKSPATNPVSVMDYDKQRDYRFLIACENMKLYNYNTRGNQVKGWEMPSIRDTLKRTAHHFAIGQRDYIVFVDNKGGTMVVDRRGKARLKLLNKLPKGNQAVFVVNGSNLEGTSLVSRDSVGNVVQLYFNDEVEHKKMFDFSSPPNFYCEDMDKDGNPEFIFVTSDQLMVYNGDKDLVFSWDFDSPVTHSPQFFRFPDGTGRIGICTAGSEEIYLFNEAGFLHEGFPLSGASPFAIGDLNKDGNLNLVVGNQSKNLYTYTLE